MSGIVNKIKEAVHSDSSKTSSAPEGTYGPHSSRMANAADPRVDSDRDGSNRMGATGATRTAGHGEYGSGNPLTGSKGMTGSHGVTGSHGMTGGSHGIGSGTAEGTYGPHSSRMANAMDPRVDSDRDGSNAMGSGMGSGRTMGGIGSGGSTGMTGTHGAPAGTHGPHSSRVGNVLDPRVDSDRDGRGALGGRSGPGPAPNTAGPHQSDMLNKVDPRVDSDRDGSTTLGNNRTYQ